MKSTGIVRKIDELGRIVVPAEIRKIFHIEVKDPVEIFTKDDMIILKKYENSCVFCGTSEDMKFFKDKNVCLKCINEL
jgi:transcriptional pleiotropic regulator of transition state genes